jgi:hypothetical protein
MKVAVVLKDVGVGENGAKAQIVLKHFPTHPKIRQ